MNEQRNQSEVARLLLHIAEEYEAAQRGLHEISCGTARHVFITQKMENMGKGHQALTEILEDPYAAMNLITQTLQ